MIMHGCYNNCSSSSQLPLFKAQSSLSRSQAWHVCGAGYRRVDDAAVPGLADNGALGQQLLQLLACCRQRLCGTALQAQHDTSIINLVADRVASKRDCLARHRCYVFQRRCHLQAEPSPSFNLAVPGHKGCLEDAHSLHMHLSKGS